MQRSQQGPAPMLTARDVLFLNYLYIQMYRFKNAAAGIPDGMTRSRAALTRVRPPPAPA
jgi:hypothetical protein